ncbi:MAG: hypothetical protein K2X94_03875 [Amoebophilaceae bacterium]|nr:hypothetical protein [Amoebophilaceae bacterium]
MSINNNLYTCLCLFLIQHLFMPISYSTKFNKTITLLLLCYIDSAGTYRQKGPNIVHLTSHRSAGLNATPKDRMVSTVAPSSATLTQQAAQVYAAYQAVSQQIQTGLQRDSGSSSYTSSSNDTNKAVKTTGTSGSEGDKKEGDKKEGDKEEGDKKEGDKEEGDDGRGRAIPPLNKNNINNQVKLILLLLKAAKEYASMQSIADEASQSDLDPSCVAKIRQDSDAMLLSLVGVSKTTTWACIQLARPSKEKCIGYH